MTVRSASRALAASGMALAFMTAPASGPDNQFGYLTPVVRVFYNRDGMNQMAGTGTIIDNHNVNGQGFFCVLTADHVVAAGGPGGNVRNGLGIAFGQLQGVDPTGYFPNNGNFMAGSLVGRLGPTGFVDLAVLAIPYGAYNPNYDQYVMGLAGAEMNVGDAFSSAGYGRVGTRLIQNFQWPNRPGIPVGGGNYWNGFDGMASDQTQRFYYNSVNSKPIIDNNALAPRGIPGDLVDPERSVEPYPGSEPPDGIFDNPRQGYTYDGLQYDLTNPTMPNAVVGEGIGYGGDSGAPYMIWSGGRQVIAGVHTYGYYLNDPTTGNPTQMKLWGFEGGGVNMTGAYRGWVVRQCEAVPEPASMLALAGGLALLLRKRSKR